MAENRLKQRKSKLQKFRSWIDGKHSRKCRYAFLRKNLTMMKRRLSNLIKENVTLKEANLELIFKLNDTNINLANVSQERHELITTNFNLMVDCNKKSEENVKLVRALRLVSNDFKKVLTNVGELSEGLINMNNMLESNFLNSFNAKGQKIQKSLTVGPMVSGHVIHKPTVSLQRLQIPCGSSSRIVNNDNTATEHLTTPSLIMAREIMQELKEERENEFNLTTIQEESPSEFQRNTIRTRGRLGLRRHHSFSIASSSDSESVTSKPGTNSQVMKVPVVRLHDVSRMLSNSSWCTIPQVDLEEATSSESEASEQEEKIIFQESNACMRRKSCRQFNWYGNSEKMYCKTNDNTPSETVQPSTSFQSSTVHMSQSELADPEPNKKGSKLHLRNINFRRHNTMPFLNDCISDNNSSDQQSSMDTELNLNTFERRESDITAVDTPVSINPQMPSTPVIKISSIQHASTVNISGTSNMPNGDCTEYNSPNMVTKPRTRASTSQMSNSSSSKCNDYSLINSSNLIQGKNKAGKSSVGRGKSSVNSNRKIKKKEAEGKMSISNIKGCPGRRSTRVKKAVDYKES